jgi:hypothetical protein
MEALATIATPTLEDVNHATIRITACQNPCRRLVSPRGMYMEGVYGALLALER